MIPQQSHFLPTWHSRSYSSGHVEHMNAVDGDASDESDCLRPLVDYFLLHLESQSRILRSRQEWTEWKLVAETSSATMATEVTLHMVRDKQTVGSCVGKI
ncbi:hypothetical protein PsorP6_016332 [Peronosclerospora sorghi]|uniref:Uncharacterized protein n=1 Tax=Peronosclerospora sorghi TaxID=230839 RepID=A0ACC0VKT2_9STRA|nr:hypothetical protein PsorP6_016332 [Peronosclerospora sorghi]